MSHILNPVRFFGSHAKPNRSFNSTFSYRNQHNLRQSSPTFSSPSALVLRQPKYKIQTTNFHSTSINSYDIATLMKVFGKVQKTKKEERLEREAKKGKIQDHSKVKEETIKERILKITEEIKDPLNLEGKSVHDILKERNSNGSIFDRYCHQFGVDPEDENTRIRISQIISRTLKKDLRELTNEEYISTKRNTLTRLLASSEYHGIFPALLPTFTPSINLCVQFNHPAYGEILVYRGNTLTPTVTSTEPKVIFTGKPDFFYTLVMVDVDYPSIFEPTGRSLVHWAVGNIPSTGHINEAEVAVSFVPPVPPVGTKTHRIAFVLFQQTHGKKPIKISSTVNESFENREKFDIVNFAQSNNLLPVGLSFFQTKWDAQVSKNYESLGLAEPQYVEEERLARLERRFVVPQQNTFNFKPVPLPNSE